MFHVEIVDDVAKKETFFKEKIIKKNMIFTINTSRGIKCVSFSDSSSSSSSLLDVGSAKYFKNINFK
jgi:hypothetical protein